MILKMNEISPNIIYDAITNDAFKYSFSNFLDVAVNTASSVKGMDSRTIQYGNDPRTVICLVILGRRVPKSMIKALEVSTLRRFGGSHWLLFCQLSQLPDNLKPSWVGDLESGIV